MRQKKIYIPKFVSIWALATTQDKILFSMGFGVDIRYLTLVFKPQGQTHGCIHRSVAKHVTPALKLHAVS